MGSNPTPSSAPTWLTLAKHQSCKLEIVGSIPTVGTMSGFARGINPRLLPGHRERGPQRFSYTFEDVALAAGCATSTVRRAKATGLDMRNFAIVVDWVMARREK